MFTGQAWWLTSTMTAVGKLRQESHQLKASFGYTVKTCQNVLFFKMKAPTQFHLHYPGNATGAEIKLVQISMQPDS